MCRGAGMCRESRYIYMEREEAREREKEREKERERERETERGG
jgi:hypothetical protein